MQSESLFNIDNMLKNGFTRRFALYYKSLAEEDYKKGLWPEEQIYWAHSRGFLADKIAAYKLNDTNYLDYLSDYDYYRLWPLNNPYRIWINDKLTLKYILPGNLFGKYLPEYYFYIEERGIMKLLDCQDDQYQNNVSGIIKLLKHKKKLAMKLVNGTCSNNFFKLSWNDNSIYVNAVPYTPEEFRCFINDHLHYLITEYLIPSNTMRLIHDKIHTLRLMVINEHGNDPRIVHGYLRFGTNQHGEANFLNKSSDCKASFDFYVNVNIETGQFGDALKVYPDKIIPTPNHPDTGVLAAGIIPNWEELVTKVLEISRYLFQVEYSGFDIGITEDGFKIMEINSHQEIRLQFFRSLYEDEYTCAYFKNRIAAIDAMTMDEKQLRANIQR